MNFWWYFILFLLVPILVHLFDFRKARKLHFSSVKYIINFASKTKSNTRLKYFLILSNRILIFSSLIVLIVILLAKQQFSSGAEGLVGVHFDNSISSSLGNADVKVENGLRQIKQEAGAMLLFNNQSKSFIDKNSIVSVSNNKTPRSISLANVFDLFNENSLTTHYLFSDFQTIDVDELKKNFVDSLKSYHLILTNDLSKMKNVSIDSLYLIPNQDNLSELSILVRFKVFNMASGSVVVKLVKGTRQLSSVVKDVTELDVVRFDISKDNYGDFEIVIDGDDVSFDNTFHFTIGERLKSRITILSSEKRDIIRAVYRNSQLFEVEEQDVTNLDFERLKESDLVVITNQNSLPEALRNQLENVSFIIFPSDSIDVDSYEDFIDVSMLSSERVLSEISIDSNHPLLKGVFEEKLKDGLMPSEVSLFQIKGNFEPVIQFRGGNTFLLKKKNVYFFNSSFKSNSGGFKSNALFLPILYQIAFSATGSMETPYYYPGERIIVSAKATDIPIKLVRNNYEIIPAFNSNGSQIILELPDDLLEGKYTLMRNQDTLRRISINIPKDESIMKAPNFEEMKRALADLNNVSVSKIIDSDDIVFATGSQSSLWKYALILAVFLILTETVLHRYLR
ncbi:BatA domain-containing protein [Ekhidna sp.]|uniref:BatA domain-containing protein n=1 Tax=Ekhidna sp. TaxID=2608089 RepID=UPI00329A1E07